MSTVISIPDQRMLLLMEYAIKKGIAISEGDYWVKIGFARTNISNLKRGIQSFRIEHIVNACRLTGASANWVLGLEKIMFRQVMRKTSIELLHEAVAQAEVELKATSEKVTKKVTNDFFST